MEYLYSVQKIIDYVLVSTPDHTTFTIQVNDLLKRGWQPYGSPFTANDYQEGSGEKVNWFYQAMVKYAK